MLLRPYAYSSMPFANYVYRLTPFYLMILNKKHEKRRLELGKTGPVADMSMLGKEQLKNSKAIEVEDIRDQKLSVEEDNGLHDMTDLKNEDFVYVY